MQTRNPGLESPFISIDIDMHPTVPYIIYARDYLGKPSKTRTPAQQNIHEITTQNILQGAGAVLLITFQIQHYVLDCPN